MGGWLEFLNRHASLVRNGVANAGNHRVARKFEWLARYHDECVAELLEETTSSDAMADELYEDGVKVDLASLIAGFFVHPRQTTP